MFDIWHLFRPLIWFLVLQQFQEQISCQYLPLQLGALYGRFQENGISHHTSKYALMQRNFNARLVVRRGQGFDIQLTLNRFYDVLNDRMSFYFEHPDLANPVYVVMTTGPIDETIYSATLMNVQPFAINIKVFLPASVPIGKWILRSIQIESFSLPGPPQNILYSWEFYVIFNPWCYNDVVYESNEAARQEYVMEEWGKIWTGSTAYSLFWRYSQFHEGILEVALYLIELGQILAGQRNNPVAIARVLSAALNAEDDNGVLVGRWDGNYDDGVAPQTWFDSKDILLQYYNTKRPVKYGQCWVFAAIYTTISRALGLGCRPVTNFMSFHDTDGDLRLNKYIDSYGRDISSPPDNDPMWNFHVWAEIWTARPDLLTQYNGWQAVDATAQERSEGIFRCGPASLHAVKHGHNDQLFDVRFMFASVNADVYTWRIPYSGAIPEFVNINTGLIGSAIITKAVGSWSREDITHLYKYPEYSSSERQVMNYAISNKTLSTTRATLVRSNFAGINFELIITPEKPVIGQLFRVKVSMRNVGRVSAPILPCTVTIYLHVVLLGHFTADVPLKMQWWNDLMIHPSGMANVHLDVGWDDYGRKLLNQNTFKIVSYGTASDSTGQRTFYNEDYFSLENPKLDIKPIINPIAGQEVWISGSLVNPLPYPITNAVFHMITDPTSIPYRHGTILTGKSAYFSFKMIAPPSGIYAIVRFSADQFFGIEGFIFTDVLSSIV